MAPRRANNVTNLAEMATTFQTNSNTIEFAYDSIEEAFPLVEAGRRPVGHNILVQVRQPKTKSKGGIFLSQDARATEHYNTRVAKVIGLGPLCFTSTHTRDDDGKFLSELVQWPEGSWFHVGDFVEIPQYGGMRFTVATKVQREEYNTDERIYEMKTVLEEVTFAMFKAKDILAVITTDPRTIKSYTD